MSLPISVLSAVNKGHKIFKNKRNSKEVFTLEQFCKEEWASLSVSTRINLVATKPKRLVAVTPA